jgi:hypothetical protein
MRNPRARTTANTAKFFSIVAALLFLSAGTLRFWQAWLYLAFNLAWLTLAGAYFMKGDPALVERRLTQDERVGLVTSAAGGVTGSGPGASRLDRAHLVPRRRRRVSEPLRQLPARSIEPRPLFSVLQRRDRHDFTRVEPRESRIDHRLRGHHDLRR